MSIYELIIFWVILATWLAIVMIVIAYLIGGKKINKETQLMHLTHWIFLPNIFVVWVLTSLFILMFRRDKINKISYNARLTLNRMFADWENKN